MEIGPIPGIRSVQAVKAPPAELQLSANFLVEYSAGPGDDSYSGSGRKSAGGQDDEDDEDQLEAESSSVTFNAASGGGVNFFA